MEKLKAKHDHTLTDILKVFIFTLILLMPGIFMLPSMLYYGFNEHAQSQTTITEGGWEVNNKYQTKNINNINDLETGYIYNLEELVLENGYDNTIIFTLLYCEESTNSGENFYIDEIYIWNYNANSNNQIYIYQDESTIYMNFSNNNAYTGITIENDDWHIVLENCVVYIPEDADINDIIDYSTSAYELNFSSTNFNIQEYIYNEELEVTKDITQMLNKNWKDLWQTDLFNWTNTTIMKEGLDNFTNVFGITNTSCITNLITYELIMVAIYIVIDIVLTMFKWLTHLIGSK